MEWECGDCPRSPLTSGRYLLHTTSSLLYTSHTPLQIQHNTFTTSLPQQTFSSVQIIQQLPKCLRTHNSMIYQKDMKTLNWKSPSNIQRIYFYRPLCLASHRVIMMIKYLSSVSARCNPQIRNETSWWSQHCRSTPPPTATTTTRCSTSTRWSTTPGRTFARTLHSRRWAEQTKHCTILSNIVKHWLHVWLSDWQEYCDMLIGRVTPLLFPWLFPSLAYILYVDK